jgi:hypothetical protein
VVDAAKSQGQADKAAAEQRTEQVKAENEQDQRRQEARSAAEKILQVDRSESSVDPYPAYDFMTVEQLRDLASERGVEINRDVERAHLITELRAADTGTLSAATRRGAR